ncbi:MAG: translocation/assembly module TamB domain-containing protein [Acidobacteria bacterium]|nr:translocation/assembly module TamB domain-containing protein [Acidobacteriota bacterium]
MWRKILRAIFVVLVIIAIGIIALIGWLNSPSFDRFAAERIKHELAKLNIRAEIGQADVHPFNLTVDIRNMRLFAGQASVWFFEANGFDVKLKILDLFSKRLLLDQLRLVNPTFNLAFDAQGRPNTADIDLTPLRKRPKGGAELEIGRILIEGGTFIYKNEANATSGNAGAMEIGIKPQPDVTRVNIKARDAYFLVNDKRYDIASFEINTGVNEQGAKLDRVRIVTSYVDAVVSGTMRHWAKPEYDLSLASSLDLAHFTRDIKPGVTLTGTAELTARVTGQEKQFRLTGNVTSPKMGVGGIQLIALRFEGQGGNTGEQAAEDLEALVVRGLLQASRIQTGVIELAGFRGSVVIATDQIEVNRFSASTLPGTVAGDATIKFDGTSTADAVFQSVDLHQAVATVARREFPVAGSVSGDVSLHWPATHFTQIVGRARANIESLASETGELLPTSGTATVDISRRGLNILDSDLTIGTAQANVAGLITWSNRLDLQVDATFNNLIEENLFLDALDIDLSKLTRGAVRSLSGTGTFSGRIEGPVSRVSLSGMGTIRGLNMEPGQLLAGRANIEYHNRVVTLTDVTASLDDGSRASLDLFRVDLNVENGIAIKGQVQQFNLSRWWERINFSLPVTGIATGSFDLTGLPGAPRGQADITLVQGRLQPPQFTVAFDRLTANLTVTERGYQLAQVRLERGPNVITLSGTYQPQTREFAFTARGLDLDVSQFDDELERRGYPLTGRLDFQLSGSGTVARPELDGQFHLAELTIAGREAGTVNGEVHAERGDIRWNVVSELFNQRLLITGRLDLSDPAQPLTVHADLNQFQATPYLALFGVSPDIGLVLTGQFDLSWPLVFPERRRVTANLTQLQATFDGYLLTNENPVNIRLTGSRLDIAETRLRGENTDLKLGGTIDFASVPEGGSLLRQSQLNLAVEGTVNLQIASAFYAGLFTGGLARIQASLRGSLENPNLSGIADIENASMRLINFPVAFTEGRGRIRFTQDRLLLEAFVGKANEGDVRVSGGLLAKNLRPERWRFNIRTDNVVVRYPEGLRSVIDSELVLQGSRPLQVLSGFVNVRRVEYTRNIDLAELLLQREALLRGPSTVAGPPQTSLALDIRVQAVDTIFIRNNLADAQASAWLHVGGTVANPDFSGRVTVARGTLELQNRPYEITVATFDFPERPGQEVRFNVEAQGEVSGYQVTIGISGTPRRFKPTLRSEPPLPTEAVISLITTGRTDTISRETQALAQSSLGIATSLISVALSQRLEERIARQRFFGINRFQIEPLLVGSGSDPTARITLGQQITKNLSITYSVNVASSEEPIVILEYRLSNRFYLVGARDEKGELSVDFRVRKRF